MNSNEAISMTKTHWIVFALVVVVVLFVGVVVGFVLGVASTDAGKAFFADVLEDEQVAQVSRPNTIVREKFKLKYPSNWNINVEDKDYDPDGMFSIHSPGSAFVMFAFVAGETTPEDSLRAQIRPFEKKMVHPTVSQFEKYGRYSGKGAIMKGRIMGMRTTVKLFSFRQNDLEVMMTQYCLDEDMIRVQPGFRLIEGSFALTAGGK